MPSVDVLKKTSFVDFEIKALSMNTNNTCFV